MSSIVPAAKQPTHRLTVKLESGAFKEFYLTEKEAEWLAGVINGTDRFIVLPRSVDSSAPSFYPKTGAWMQRMTEDERRARANRYILQAQPQREVEDEEKRRKESEAVREWIAGHETEFAALLQKAREKLESAGGIYFSASENVRNNLVRYEAMRAVALQLAK